MRPSTSSTILRENSPIRAGGVLLHRPEAMKALISRHAHAMDAGHSLGHAKWPRPHCFDSPPDAAATTLARNGGGEPSSRQPVSLQSTSTASGHSLNRPLFLARPDSELAVSSAGGDRAEFEAVLGRQKKKKKRKKKDDRRAFYLTRSWAPHRSPLQRSLMSARPLGSRPASEGGKTTTYICEGLHAKPAVVSRKWLPPSRAARTPCARPTRALTFPFPFLGQNARMSPMRRRGSCDRIGGIGPKDANRITLWRRRRGRDRGPFGLGGYCPREPMRGD